VTSEEHEVVARAVEGGFFDEVETDLLKALARVEQLLGREVSCAEMARGSFYNLLGRRYAQRNWEKIWGLISRPPPVQLSYPVTLKGWKL